MKGQNRGTGRLTVWSRSTGRGISCGCRRGRCRSCGRSCCSCRCRWRWRDGRCRSATANRILGSSYGPTNQIGQHLVAGHVAIHLNRRHCRLRIVLLLHRDIGNAVLTERVRNHSLKGLDKVAHIVLGHRRYAYSRYANLKNRRLHCLMRQYVHLRIVQLNRRIFQIGDNVVHTIQHVTGHCDPVHAQRRRWIQRRHRRWGSRFGTHRNHHTAQHHIPVQRLQLAQKRSRPIRRSVAAAARPTWWSRRRATTRRRRSGTRRFPLHQMHNFAIDVVFLQWLFIVQHSATINQPLSVRTDTNSFGNLIFELSDSNLSNKK
jgi:hypothetical protein